MKSYFQVTTGLSNGSKSEQESKTKSWSLKNRHSDRNQVRSKIRIPCYHGEKTSGIEVPLGSWMLIQAYVG